MLHWRGFKVISYITYRVTFDLHPMGTRCSMESLRSDARHDTRPRHESCSSVRVFPSRPPIPALRGVASRSPVHKIAPLACQRGGPHAPSRVDPAERREFLRCGHAPHPNDRLHSCKHAAQRP